MILVCAGAAASAGPLSFLLSHHDLEVYTDGDITPEGKDLPRPDPQHPLYYLAIAAGYKDFGKPIAGEKPPKQKVMIDVITKVLDKQGYKLATNKNPPQVVIVYSWGTMNADRMSGTSFVWNEGQVLDFLGYTSKKSSARPDRAFPELAPGLSFVNGSFNELSELGRLDYHAIALAAYDYKAFCQGKAVTLWRTHISSPSLGFDMFDALPKIAAMAAPQIGRQTDAPVHILADDHYRPDIEFGEAVVVPEGKAKTE